MLRTSLTSPQAIDDLVRTAREHGFNTLLVQVRGRGDAYYTAASNRALRSCSDSRCASIRWPPCSNAAHAAGLRVHAWVNVNLVSSAADLPIAPTTSSTVTSG